MQTIKILSVLLTLSVTVAMADIDLPASKKITEVHVIGKYAKQLTEVYSIDKELICKTEQVPYYVADKKKSAVDLKALTDAFITAAKINSKPPKCVEPVILKQKNKADAVLCKDDKAATDFLSKLSKFCGRSL